MAKSVMADHLREVGDARWQPDGATSPSGSTAAKGHQAQPALTLLGVTRCHAGRSTWAPVDLRLDAGTVCVLTGSNGSGKTTLLRVAAGLLRLS